MRLFAVGVSHRTTPIELRERVDFARAGVAPALAGLAARNVVREMVVLSTCNRAEIYAAADSDDAVEGVVAFFSEYHQVEAAQLCEHLCIRHGADAARHLFRVAAGLDSLVVGEPQILGQVKTAYAAAGDAHYTGSLLNRLFHTAFAAGKRVRSETGLGEGAISVSYAAIALARKIFGELKGLRVVVLGSGEMAKLTGVHLRAQGVENITIASRTRSAAERAAAHIQAQVVDWAGRDEAMLRADILVTATGAPEVVLTRGQVARVMRARRERPLFIIDIAVPRDVDAGAANIEQVFLYNIDDLQGIVHDNLARRTAELALADAIVEEETHRFVSWMQSRDVIPTVVALRQRFEAIRRAELSRLNHKLSGLPPEALAQVDHVTKLIVEKLLLTPTEQLKAVSDDGLAASYSDALNRLFSLEDAPAGPVEEPQSLPRRRAGSLPGDPS
ncbi:MAG TPA: glutamyl-tRNA reductase [Vicinamibacterales bacterium]|nr:glutamyl-tRNA reductase [Vicinamibacterales bacterium]